MLYGKKMEKFPAAVWFRMLYGKKIGKVPFCSLISYVVWNEIGKVICCSLISYVVWKKNRKSSLLQSDFVCCMEKKSGKLSAAVWFRMLYGKKIGKVPCCSLISNVVWKENWESSLLQSDLVGCMEKNRKSFLLQSDSVCCMEKRSQKFPVAVWFRMLYVRKIGKVPCCSLISCNVWKKWIISLLQSYFVCCMEKKIGKVPFCSLISYVVWNKIGKVICCSLISYVV